jgi:XTP/dITP diphosphohydrolase
MARRFSEDKLIVASHNKGKLVEIAELLTRFDVETVGADELGLPEPEETGKTFIANAELKALASATKAGLPALADDSGLAVDALDGAPGIYSARWAQTPNGRDFDFGMHKIEMAMSQKQSGEASPVPRTARFICALSLAWPMVMWKVLKARSRAHWSGRCAGKTALAMTQYFCRLGAI